VSLKESIEGKLKIPTRIRLGGPGALDVFVEKQKIYSKKQTGLGKLAFADSCRKQGSHNQAPRRSGWRKFRGESTGFVLVNAARGKDLSEKSASRRSNTAKRGRGEFP
jgi:hypothetical protein